MRPEVLALEVATAIKGAIGPIHGRLLALETDTATRLTALEARAPVAGPMGPAGPAGRDGLDGAPGKDGAGLRYLGVHVAGKTYDPGDLVTAGGSAWYCGRTTTTTPGHSPDWQLMVKRGRDAR
jgi:hypothetical protein